VSTFVDTSAFLALMNPDDRNHAAARSAWLRLLSLDVPLLTTNYVVVETVSLLHKRFGMGPVRRFHEDITSVLTIHWVDPAMHASAQTALMVGGRSGPSLVDCVSFAAIDRLRAQSVLAFDAHFSDRGFVLRAGN
jgi:predicted nucleic acid-binding protein